MSICAVSLVDADRALVAVDTACEVFGHSEHFECAKLHLMPHAGLVLAGLGQGEVTQLAFHSLHRPGREVDFDLAAASMRGILERARLVNGVDFHVNAKLTPEWFGGNLVYLVGYSRRAACMQARAYLNMPGEQHFTEHEIPRWSVHPRDWSLEITVPTTIEEIESLARAAVHYGKSVEPDHPYGGRLIVAELRRDSIMTFVRPCHAT